MKIFILECDAEELKANRTIMDSVSDAINGFFDAFCGARVDLSQADIAKAMLNNDNEESEDNEDE